MRITGELRYELGADHAILKYWESDTELHVDTVFVPASARQRGVGTALMERVLGLADTQAKPVSLKARPIGVTSVEALQRLLRYYERLGFLLVKREASSADMVRPHRRREATATAPRPGGA